MSDVSIKELSNLTRAVNGIVDKISRDPFKSMHEDGRHQEIIGIQKTQTEISKKFTFFTELLALATTVLAFYSILIFFNVKIPYNYNGLTLIISVLSSVLFFICCGFLIYKTFKYLMMKE